MNRFDWINESRKGIDACDAAAIMGVDKKKNILDIYIEKTRRTKKINIMEDALYWDLKLEELVAREFAFRSGKKVRKGSGQQYDKDYKYMITNIDRTVNGENGILECKVVKNDEAKDFEEDLLNSYLVQAQHSMKVKGADAYYIAALINSERFIYKKIDRDDNFISKIIETEKDFWINHIEKKVKPEINKKQISY